MQNEFHILQELMLILRERCSHDYLSPMWKKEEEKNHLFLLLKVSGSQIPFSKKQFYLFIIIFFQINYIIWWEISKPNAHTFSSLFLFFNYFWVQKWYFSSNQWLNLTLIIIFICIFKVFSPPHVSIFLTLHDNPNFYFILFFFPKFWNFLLINLINLFNRFFFLPISCSEVHKAHSFLKINTLRWKCRFLIIYLITIWFLGFSFWRR